MLNKKRIGHERQYRIRGTEFRQLPLIRKGRKPPPGFPQANRPPLRLPRQIDRRKAVHRQHPPGNRGHRTPGSQPLQLIVWS